MKYLVGTTAETNAWRTALDVADGLPRRASAVGGPDALPASYSAGAPGWTSRVAGPASVLTDGRRRLEVPTRAEHHLGAGGLPSGSSECILITGQSNGTLTVAPDLGDVCVVNMAVFGSMVTAWDPVAGPSYEAAVAAVGSMLVREIWDNQGEADSTSPLRAAAYKARKEAEYAAFRARFGASLRIRSTLLTTASLLAHAATVRAAQQAIVDEQEHTYGFDMSPYQLADDGLHFGPTSLPSVGPQYVAIGLALGAAFLGASA